MMRHQICFLWRVILFIFYLNNQGMALTFPKTTMTSCRRGLRAHVAAVDSGWNADNVYEDIANLRRAIALDQAEGNLRVSQARQLLDTFAANRRPLFQDIKNFVIFPCLLAYALATPLFRYKPKLCLIKSIITKLFVFEFWTMEVVMPILFLIQKKRDRLDIGINYMPLNRKRSPLTEYIDSGVNGHCEDFVLCLLEQWVSAVFGTFCFGLWSSAFSKYNHSYLWSFVRLATRLGSISSLHQYPELLFKLRHQPRPWRRSETTLRQLSDFLLKFVMIGLIIDLSEIMQRVQVPLVMLSLFVGLTDFLHPKRLLSRWNPPKKLRCLKLIGANFLNWSPTLFASFLLCKIPFTFMKAWTFPIAVTCLGPSLHIFALKKLGRITYSDGEPLKTGEKPETQDKQEKHLGSKRWRYELSWRKPARIGSGVSNYIKGVYILGSSTEKLRRKFPSNFGNENSFPENLLDYCEFYSKEIASEPLKVKHIRMKELAKEHKKDYKEGKFRDPLGIAIQQTFGIGLGFGDGYMDPLPANEKPCLGRLQARVAKSAIKRVNDIYDEALKEDLDAIGDPLEREIRKAQIREKDDAEIDYVKSQLEELVPRKYTGNVTKPIHFSQYGSRNVRLMIQRHHFPYPPYGPNITHPPLVL
mmetsp:Transcript_18079/g.27387  ORF Transcript_18079/g.27387 Transcript_18079/m.27387 type:complete len:642 (+) Transcript_18079:102-2027(+)